MIKTYLYIFFFSLSTLVYSQDIDVWKFKHADGETTEYHGLFNKCVPFQLLISVYPDSVVGIWKLHGRQTHILHGKEQDKVYQLIEFDDEGNPSGYIFLNAEIAQPRFAYWVNHERHLMRIFPLTYVKYPGNSIFHCMLDDMEMAVKQTNPYTYKGSIFNLTTQVFQSFILSDSLYLTSYSSLIPQYHNLSRESDLAHKIQRCHIFSSDKIPLKAFCKNQGNSYSYIAFPEIMQKELQAILMNIESRRKAWVETELDKRKRFGFMVNTEVIPFYIGEEFISFILQVNKNDGTKEMIPINWSRNKEEIIDVRDVFQRRFDLEAFISKKSAMVKKKLLEEEPQKADYIENLHFDFIVLSKTGFVFISQCDRTFGWRSFFIPYEEFEGEYRWFHPLKSLW